MVPGPHPTWSELYGTGWRGLERTEGVEEANVLSVPLRYVGITEIEIDRSGINVGFGFNLLYIGHNNYVFDPLPDSEQAAASQSASRPDRRALRPSTVFSTNQPSRTFINTLPIDFLHGFRIVRRVLAP